MSFVDKELKGQARLVDGWDDLNKAECRTFILRSLTDYYECSEELENAKTTVENQNRYIEQLEKQVRLLQKTLDVVYKNASLESKIDSNDFAVGMWREDTEE